MPSYSLFLKQRIKNKLYETTTKPKKYQRFFVLPPETFFKHYFTIFSFSARFSSENKNWKLFFKSMFYIVLNSRLRLMMLYHLSICVNIHMHAQIFIFNLLFCLRKTIAYVIFPYLNRSPPLTTTAATK